MPFSTSFASDDPQDRVANSYFPPHRSANPIILSISIGLLVVSLSLLRLPLPVFCHVLVRSPKSIILFLVNSHLFQSLFFGHVLDRTSELYLVCLSDPPSVRSIRCSVHLSVHWSVHSFHPSVLIFQSLTPSSQLFIHPFYSSFLLQSFATSLNFLHNRWINAQFALRGGSMFSIS